MKRRPVQQSIVDQVVREVQARLGDVPHGAVRTLAGRLLTRGYAEIRDGRADGGLVEDIAALYKLIDETVADDIGIRVTWDRSSASRGLVQTVMRDRPFIVDTLREYLHSVEIDIPYLLHPIFTVSRDAAGRVAAISDGPAEGERLSVTHTLIDGAHDKGARQRLEPEVRERLDIVRVVTSDFDALLERVAAVRSELGKKGEEAAKHEAELGEIRELLDWLAETGFVFLGYRGYGISTDARGRDWIRVDENSGLGILRNDRDSTYHEPRAVDELPAELRARLLSGPLLIVSKTNAASPIRRHVRMDYVGIKRLGPDGRVRGEHRFLGLFTAKAFSQDASSIPILRRKLDEILAQEGVVWGSHDHNLILGTFNSMPKEELFLASVRELRGVIEAVMTAAGADDVRLSVRPDQLGRGVHIMVILPRNHFSSEVRRKLQAALIEAYQGTVLNYHLALGQGDQARLHFYLARDAGVAKPVDRRAVQATVRAIVRTWEERLEDALIAEHGPERGHHLAERLVRFSEGYKAAVEVGTAVGDVEQIERLAATRESQVWLRPAASGADRMYELRLFSEKGQFVLSDVIPTLENFGLKVLDSLRFTVEVEEPGFTATIHLFEAGGRPDDDFDIIAAEDRIGDALRAIHAGETEDDRLNQLIVTAGLTWQEAGVLRTYSGYAFRIGAVASPAGGQRPLTEYPAIARSLFRVFEARFDPAAPERRREVVRHMRRFTAGLASVRGIEADRTLRRLMTLIQSTVRTSYYLKGRGAGTSGRDAGAIGAVGEGTDLDGRGAGGSGAGASGGGRHGVEGSGSAGGEGEPLRRSSVLAIKIAGRSIDFLPEPKPKYEVYLRGTRTEATHLRMEDVARGGIRWSFRRGDFRVEVLGLVKTQRVKNAVIVPGGAKGAFISKKLPEQEAARAAAGLDSYREFIRGLLEIADNIVGGEVRHPEDMVIYDGPDPYLVVAADKGTAGNSDIANELSAEMGYWMGDAFASGGSQGYDHKKEGITARGAWECVKRHFREANIDYENDPFTVVGIGDMSGDVFGNGMLLSKKIKLVAAFDHRHIFLDPDPDPRRSWAERKRLFDLPNSSWADYDSTLLRKGGGVYERAAKRIPLSRRTQKRLSINEDVVNGDELIRAILKAEVDLLWNGGIGTYVKASSESHADVGDPSGDATRVDAAEVKARVVGEGGNLGFTQSARVQFALAGGRINTDAVDNSGGVDMSDHEVNLKILLRAPLSRGKLGEKERAALLKRCTDEVASRVLGNSYAQSLAISLDYIRARRAPAAFRQVIRRLEHEGVLDPAREHLPLEKELVDREKAAGVFMTRPELATLLAHSKLHLKQLIHASIVPEDPAMMELVKEYFPPGALAAVDPRDLAEHRLRTHIASTALTNLYVDRMGAASHVQLMSETGRAASTVARTWYVASRISDADRLFERLHAVDGRVPTGAQSQWYLVVSDALARATRWLLQNNDSGQSVGAAIERLHDPVRGIRSALPKPLAINRRKQYVEDGLDAETARELATFSYLDELLPVASLIREVGASAELIGKIYFGLSDFVAFPWLRAGIERLASADPWDRRAARILMARLENARSRMTARIAADAKGTTVDMAMRRFMQKNAVHLNRVAEVIEDVKMSGEQRFSSFVVAVDAVNDPAIVNPRGAAA